MLTLVSDYRNALGRYTQTLQVRGYSASTTRTYYFMFRDFLKYTYPKALHQIDQVDIMDYQLHLVQQRKVSRSYQNQSINAIKFYLEKVLGYDRQVFALERPKKQQKVLTIRSRPDVSHSFFSG